MDDTTQPAVDNDRRLLVGPDEEFDDPASEEEAIQVIVEGLVAEQEGREFSHDQFQYCCETTAALRLIRAGGDVEAVLRNFERPHEISVKYSPEDGLSVEIIWTDGEDD